jgi:hypothetical protein
MILILQPIHFLSFGMLDAFDLIHLERRMFVVPVEVFFSFVVSIDFPLVFAFGP